MHCRAQQPAYIIGSTEPPPPDDSHCCIVCGLQCTLPLLSASASLGAARTVPTCTLRVRLSHADHTYVHAHAQLHSMHMSMGEVWLIAHATHTRPLPQQHRQCWCHCERKGRDEGLGNHRTSGQGVRRYVATYCQQRWLHRVKRHAHVVPSATVRPLKPCQRMLRPYNAHAPPPLAPSMYVTATQGTHRQTKQAQGTLRSGMSERAISWCHVVLVLLVLAPCGTATAQAACFGCRD